MVRIPTNLSKTKSGTKSLKKQDSWSKIGTFFKNPMKIAKFIKLIGLTVYKNAVKKRNKAKKNWDSSKFWTKNQDCPSKSGTVGEYGSSAGWVDIFDEESFHERGDWVATCKKIFLWNFGQASNTTVLALHSTVLSCVKVFSHDSFLLTS